MPLLVISSRGVGLTTTRSPSGWSLVAVFVAVAKVFPPGDGRGRPNLSIVGATRPVDLRAGRAPRWCLCGRLPVRASGNLLPGQRTTGTEPISTLGVRVLAIVGARLRGCQPRHGIADARGTGASIRATDASIRASVRRPLVDQALDDVDDLADDRRARRPAGSRTAGGRCRPRSRGRRRRRRRTASVIAAGLQVVGDHDAVAAELAAQQVRDGRAGERRRRAGVDLAVHDVRGHDRRRRARRPSRSRYGSSSRVGPRRRHVGDAEVRVDRRAAEAREVLQRRPDAAVAVRRDLDRRVARDDGRVGRERAVERADRRVVRVDVRGRRPARSSG